MLTAIDEALLLYIVSKFSVSSADIICSPETIAFRDISEKRGKVFLPFYSFWRLDAIEAKNRVRTPLAIRSQMYALSTDKKSWAGLKGAPVDLNYELIVWAGEDGRIAMNESIEKFNFFKWETPQLQVTSDQGITFGFPMIFGDPNDISLLADKYSIGEIHRYSFPFKIEAWILEEFTWKSVHKVFIDFYRGEYPDQSDKLFEYTYTIPEA